MHFRFLNRKERHIVYSNFSFFLDVNVNIFYENFKYVTFAANWTLILDLNVFHHLRVFFHCHCYYKNHKNDFIIANSRFLECYSGSRLYGQQNIR